MITCCRKANREKAQLVEGEPAHLVDLSHLIVVVMFYFAARQGLLGKQIKKIAVEMVKEKPPEKPKEPEKPKGTAKWKRPRWRKNPRGGGRRPPPPSTVAPPSVAPPAAELPAFEFEGGKAVEPGPTRCSFTRVTWNTRSLQMEPAGKYGRRQLCGGSGGVGESRGRHQRPGLERLRQPEMGRVGAKGCSPRSTTWTVRRRRISRRA